MASLKYTRLERDAAPLVAPAIGDAGYDLRAWLPMVERMLDGLYLMPGETAQIGTGLSIEIPDGWCGLVLGRSGNAFRVSLYAAHIGLIDPHYRGEVKLLLKNDGDKAITIRHGDAVAQLLIVPFWSSNPVEISAPTETARGAKGFGSSGIVGE